MNITDIRVRKTFQEIRLKALVSITFDRAFAIHDIKVIDGKERLFVAMPSRKDEHGNFKDVAHPITGEFRNVIEEKVLAAYHAYIAAHVTEKPETTAADATTGA